MLDAKRLVACLAVLGACDGTAGSGNGSDGGPDGGPILPGAAMLAPLYVTAARPTCTFAAPLAAPSAGQDTIVIATADGTIAALDPATGAEVWNASVPAPAASGLFADLVAPPAVVGNHMVIAWQDVDSSWTRAQHRVAVLDLDARALDPTFPPLALAASLPAADGGSGAGTVDFVPAHAFSRAAVVVARPPGRELGLAYVSFGNVRDIQPWHGWVFEVDLDAWKQSGAGAAISSALVTTADASCGAEGGDGARQMLCGGGIWAQAGPQVVYDDAAPGGFYLYVPTGNGMLDPTRRQFANAILRTGPGLAFDPQCDPLLCDGFDPTLPSEPCSASCGALFVPRLLAGQSVPSGPGGGCAGMTLFQCWAAFDWDLGASAPARVPLPGGGAGMLMPGKDGAVYLADAAHLGTLLDRAPITAGCGELAGTSCAADWAGTIATHPAVVDLGASADGTGSAETVALVPTYTFDSGSPAGLQAIEIGADASGAPRLVPSWHVPSLDAPESRSAFRRIPSGVTAVDVAGEPYAAVVDVGATGQPGALYWVRVRDGALIQKIALSGSGQRFAPPLASGGRLYVPSCERTSSSTPAFEEGPSHLEAFTIVPPG
jgi:hypothetical protein